MQLCLLYCISFVSLTEAESKVKRGFMATRFLVGVGLLVVLAVSLLSLTVSAEELTGSDIVQRCDKETNNGRDQQTTLTVIIKDAAGNERKSVYRRYWKDFKGKNKLEDKLMLFTEFPPDAKDTGFMRWGYIAGEDKNAEQWLFLPSLSTIRRVSVRDPGDSFLGSDLTYQDISPRRLSQDDHQLLREEQLDGQVMYVVESLPKETNPLYGKVITWFEKAPQWADCNKRRIEHFDNRNNLIKVQKINWQQVENAWVWEKVVVENLKTGHSSIFEVSDVRVNVGLADSLFSERMLKRGVRE